MIKVRFLSKTKNINPSITTTWSVVVMLILFFSFACSNEKKETVKAVFDPETSFTLRTTDVSTLISDSGITRYRLNAAEWLIYSKAKEPYWYFPKGIYVEQFDTLFHSEASVKADTAYNFDKKKLWKLIGNVRFENLEGRTLETSLLYWDQNAEKIYSDKFVRIEDNGDVISGFGFEAQQDLKRYKLFDTSADFFVDEKSPDTVSELNSDSVDNINLSVKNSTLPNVNITRSDKKNDKIIDPKFIIKQKKIELKK